jgi:RNA polymerase sigma factor for flagellar operon FliA
MTGDDAIVTLRRTIFATPDRVYRAWLDPGVLSRWLAPPGFAVARVEIDEHNGGRYRVWLREYWFPPGFDPEAEDVAPVPAGEGAGVFECALVELVPNRRIVLDWHNVSSRRERVTISLRRASGEATRLTLLSESAVPRAHSTSHAAAEPTEHVPPHELGEIWRQYKASGDRALRDRLILTFAPLVKYVAGKLGAWLPPDFDQEDLVAYGLLGLIGAIERFEPAGGAKFETYAIARIRGAMIDELRSLDWVPRMVRERAEEVVRAMAELELRHKRTPSDEELASELGISVGELEESLMQIARSSVVALDELWRGGESAAPDDAIEDPQTPDPAERPLEDDALRVLAEAITHLPDRERLVVTLHYYEELTLRELGEVLNLTEAEAAALRVRAILRLRARLRSAAPRPSPRTKAPTAQPAPLLRRFTPMLDSPAIPDQNWSEALNRLAAALFEDPGPAAQAD